MWKPVAIQYWRRGSASCFQIYIHITFTGTLHDLIDLFVITEPEFQ